MKVVVYGGRKEFHIQKSKLCFVLIEIIIGKDIGLKLSQRENVTFAMINTRVFESSHSKPVFPQETLSNQVPEIIKIS